MHFMIVSIHQHTVNIIIDDKPTINKGEDERKASKCFRYRHNQEQHLKSLK